MTTQQLFNYLQDEANYWGSYGFGIDLETLNSFFPDATEELLENLIMEFKQKGLIDHKKVKEKGTEYFVLKALV